MMTFSMEPHFYQLLVGNFGNAPRRSSTSIPVKALRNPRPTAIPANTCSASNTRNARLDFLKASAGKTVSFFDSTLRIRPEISVGRAGVDGWESKVFAWIGVLGKARGGPDCNPRVNVLNSGIFGAEDPHELRIRTGPRVLAPSKIPRTLAKGMAYPAYVDDRHPLAFGGEQHAP